MPELESIMDSMDEVYAPFNPETTVGFDYHCNDGGEKQAPTEYELTSKRSSEWLTTHPPASLAAIRLLTVYQKKHASVTRLPWTQQTVDHAIWNPKVYTDLASSAAGGVAALLDEPYRFILQTPVDEGPFCSFALSRRGIAVKGTYVYSVSSFDGTNSDIFCPAEMLEGESVISGWRSSGLQIISLPSAFLRNHSLWMERQLTSIVSRIEGVEATLFVNSTDVPDFRELNRTLHICSSRLLTLERRSTLEKQTIAAIESVCAASRNGTIPYKHLAPLKNKVESRDREFESLPRRITNARDTINTLINQRNQAMNLEIAESSQCIAEATLSDAASMKTIAMLTMVFLPGTAVASIFSMTFFNWDAAEGNQISSHWLWIYFVITVPLTIGVMFLWWWWAKRTERHAHTKFRTLDSTPRDDATAEAGFSDNELDHEQLSGRPPSKTDEVEMQAFHQKSKGADN